MLLCLEETLEGVSGSTEEALRGVFRLAGAMGNGGGDCKGGCSSKRLLLMPSQAS